MQNDIANFHSENFHTPFYDQSIMEAIGTLQLLHSLLAQIGQIPGDTEPNMDHEILNQAPGILDEQAWSVNALDALNYVIPTDWMYEVPGPFGEYMDLGGS